MTVRQAAWVVGHGVAYYALAAALSPVLVPGLWLLRRHVRRVVARGY